MNYWLMKSEPDTFSIDHLIACPSQIEPWDGIRSYQARNTMRDQMSVGDLAFFYHSSCKVPAIVGIMQVVSKAYPDPTQFNPESKYYDPKSKPENPRWQLVDMKFVEKFNQPISLSQLRHEAALNNMELLKKGNRLSILPVSAKEWQHIINMN